MGRGSRYFPYIPTLASTVTLQAGEFIAALGRIIINEIQPAGAVLNIGGSLTKVNIGTNIITSPNGVNNQVQLPLATALNNALMFGTDGYLYRSYTNTLTTPNILEVSSLFSANYVGPQAAGDLTIRDASNTVTWIIFDNAPDVVDFRVPAKDCVLTNTTRGAATAVPAGTMIWNSDDIAPNWSDGTNWRDASGNIT